MKLKRKNHRIILEKQGTNEKETLNLILFYHRSVVSKRSKRITSLFDNVSHFLTQSPKEKYKLLVNVIEIKDAQ